MPQNPPPTSQAFLNAVSACTYSGGLMRDTSGVANYCHVNSLTGAWNLVTAVADTVDATTFGLLSGATANADGSFTAASGAAYWLEEARGNVAVAVAK